MLPLLVGLLLAGQDVLPLTAPVQDVSFSVRVLIVLTSDNALPTVTPIMITEVERIWRPAGVEFQWTQRLPDREPQADRLILVKVTDHAKDGWRVPAGALGGVPIVAGRIRQAIYVSPSTVRQLVSTTGTNMSEGQFTSLYARMLGRVIAHELGHLLLRSFDHRATGVMRPSFGSRDVMSTDHTRFSLGVSDVAIMRHHVRETRAAATALAPPLRAALLPSQK